MTTSLLALAVLTQTSPPPQLPPLGGGYPLPPSNPGSVSSPSNWIISVPEQSPGDVTGTTTWVGKATDGSVSYRTLTTFQHWQMPTAAPAANFFQGYGEVSAISEATIKFRVAWNNPNYPPPASAVFRFTSGVQWQASQFRAGLAVNAFNDQTYPYYHGDRAFGFRHMRVPLDASGRGTISTYQWARVRAMGDGPDSLGYLTTWAQSWVERPNCMISSQEFQDMY